jgi:large subunit ribosomal protein L22
MPNLKNAVSATSKDIKISPTKINIILAKIRGKSYKEALEILKYLPQKASSIFWQTLYAAIINASKNFGLDKGKLIVIEAYANQGPMLKRMQPRAKGRAFKIQKRISHVTIRVSEDNKE